MEVAPQGSRQAQPQQRHTQTKERRVGLGGSKEQRNNGACGKEQAPVIRSSCHYTRGVYVCVCACACACVLHMACLEETQEFVLPVYTVCKRAGNARMQTCIFLNNPFFAAVCNCVLQQKIDGRRCKGGGGHNDIARTSFQSTSQQPAAATIVLQNIIRTHAARLYSSTITNV